MPNRLAPATVVLFYAIFAALWIVASHHLLISILHDQALLNRIELIKGLMFVVVTSGLLYLLLKKWLAPPDHVAAQPDEIPPAPGIARMMLLFIALALIAPLIGLLVAKLDGPQIEHAAYANLEAVARLKSEQIENWLDERYGDGIALAVDEEFAERVDQLVRQQHDTKLSAPILRRLDNLRIFSGYDSILLLDSSGKSLLMLGNQDRDSPTLQQLVSQALSGHQIQRGELFRAPSGNAYLDWVVPIFGQQGKAPVAAIVLRTSAQRFLFPLIQTWPTASRSAETLLVRQEKTSAFYLNELRHVKEAPLTLTRPLADLDFLPAIALRTAKPGTAAGKDYRNVPVLAAYRRVSGTDWLLIAKIDRDEVLASLQEMTFWVTLVVLAAVAALSVALLLLWRQQQHAQSLALLVHKSKADRLLKQFFDLPFIGIATISPSTKRWVQFNEHLCTILGYSRDELAEKPWTEMMHPDDLDASLRNLERVIGGDSDGYAMNMRYIRKDGAVVFSDVDIKCIRKPDGAVDHLITMVQDITNRKLAERELQIAATAFETQESIMVMDAHNTILRVNKAFTRLTGYSAEEAIGKTPSLLKSDRHDEQFYRNMWDSIARNRFWRGEIWNRYKNGETHPGWLNITAVTSTSGEVTNYIATYYDITQYKEADDKIRLLAFYDSLTQLPNRRLLLDRLQQALAASSRHHKFGALLFIDLDNFKTLNDTKGHNIGDLLLVEVASRIQACVRKEDTVARLGGDEFVIMLVELSEDMQKAAARTESICEQILATVSQPYILQGHEHYSSASVGICLFQGDAVPVEDLLKRTDTAMYEAKNAGRNTMRFYDPAMQAALEARAILESDLRRALERDEFCLYYQPQVDMANGKIIGAEALLRWQHPEHGLIMPGQFIPLAEDTGLIVPIGEWALRSACAQAKQWAAMGYDSLRIAVNLSARQFWHKDFTASLTQILNDSGIPAHMLELEITESLAMHEAATVIAILRTIRSMGIRLSIDDFGTGYSSLNHLKHLPIGMLKIDQSFVRDVISDPDDAAIVKAIITMAHSLHLSVIAEGVETQSQLAFLEQLHCDEIQGYLFSKPLTVEDFTGYLLEDRRLEFSAPRDESPQRTLLLVDDEANIRSSLMRLLRGSGYRILTAASGEKALELLALNSVGVILSDHRMPGMTGVELLRRVKGLYPLTVRMLLTGYAEFNAITDAVNEGSVYKFLIKPWADDQLRANIEEAFSHFEMKRENARLQDEISRINNDVVEEASDHIDVLQISQEILENLTNAVIGVDELGMIMFANRKANELFDAAQLGTLLGSQASERLPAAMSDGLNGKRNMAIVLPDGRPGEVWFHSMGSRSLPKGVMMEVIVSTGEHL